MRIQVPHLRWAGLPAGRQGFLTRLHD